LSQIVRCGLIQCSNPVNDESRPVAEIQQAMLEKHLQYIDEAGQKGVQILCLQEIFNGPYFCPSQSARWYGAAEPVPGPTTALMSEYAKKYNMVIIVPVYEEAMRGVYYNTAAVIDADGQYLGKYRKQHIPHTSGFWEKYFFKPGDGGYPVFNTRYAKVGVYICYDRHFPEGWRALGLNGAEIVFNPSATVAGLSQLPLEARTTRRRRGEHLLCRRHQPCRHRGALGHRQVLRHVLLRGPARQVFGGSQRRQR
jgi:beta-ureidopropionase